MTEVLEEAQAQGVVVELNGEVLAVALFFIRETEFGMCQLFLWCRWRKVLGEGERKLERGGGVCLFGDVFGFA